MRLGEYLNVKKMQNGGEISDYTQGECPIGFLDVNGQCKTFNEVAQMKADEREQNQLDEDVSSGQYSLPEVSVLTNVQNIDRSDFSQLSGLAKDPQALASYLRTEFGLQDAEKYTQDFEEYNPFKERKLQESFQMGLDQAQAGARSQLSDLFSQARRAGVSSGFGGTGKRLAELKGKTLGNLESQRQKLGSSLESGVQDLREDYVSDFLNQITKLGQMGASFNPVG